ncbi:MAG: uncharacterized protein K0R15_1896 [Clostridiales bacterium]|jgi:NADPH-dependent 7-cyano-7-deazaguanine reductase QueF|nr:uncharacterized protein [Clostridiales bacterium]
MKKKVISIMLSIFLLSSINFTVLAEENGKYVTQAEQLKTLGVFQGSDKGLELNRQPQRLEGLVMLIRLLGKEAEATALKTEDCFFTDVPDWGRGYVNYAYKNGLTVGKGGKLFGSGDLMNAKSYVTFMLRALGYSDSKGDFSYNEALDFGFERGLLTLSSLNELSKNVFLRDHIAKVSLDTLYTNIKGSDKTLLEKLISDGSISEEKVNELNGKESSSSEPGTSNTNTYTVAKPTGVILAEVDNSEVTVYWDKIENADFYRVYYSDSLNGEYEKLLDEYNYNTDKWFWDNEYCLTLTGLGYDTTLYVKITAVNDGVESQASDVVSITTKSKKLYPAYQDKLMNTYKNFNTTNYNITINEIDIDDRGYDDYLEIKLYFDKQNLPTFMNMKENEWNEVEEKLLKLGSGIADENNTDVDVYLIFRDDFTEYPEQFADNRIFNKSVTAISNSKYEVYYPFVRIMFEIDTYEYYIEMGDISE